MARLEDLKPFIKDEEDANIVYTEMAEEANRSGMEKTAQILRGMAADELRHKEMLEGMYYNPELEPIREKTLTEEIEEAYEKARETGEVTVSVFRTGRSFPKTMSEWADLCDKIKKRDPGVKPEADAALNDIYQDTGDVASAKRWLTLKAGELDIT